VPGAFFFFLFPHLFPHWGGHQLPELPEVEAYRRFLTANAIGRRIASVPRLDASVVRHAEPQALAAQLVGSRVVATYRHGKLLFAGLSHGSHLVLHFGMTGDLKVHAPGEEPRHARLVLDFDQGDSLSYVCMRKFGYLSLTDDPEGFVRGLGWGPDALNQLDERTFAAGLATTSSPVKAALMDQRRWAGIGNLYADEALFQARIRPAVQSDRLGPRRVHRLYETVKEVLGTAVERGADFEAYPDGYLLTNRGPDVPCPRCGTGLRSTKIGGRTTIYCTRCQNL
jgi:formamidopyrimidine-DNA glycosylase